MQRQSSQRQVGEDGQRVHEHFAEEPVGQMPDVARPDALWVSTRLRPQCVGALL
jgi:hypothetical protein